jgi:hypothetical protein
MAVIVPTIESPSINSTIENPFAPRTRSSGTACPLTFVDPYGDERLQLQEALLPDAFDVHQILNFLKAAALLPVLENPLRGGRPDAGKRLQLRLRGGVQIYGGRCGSRSAAFGGWRFLGHRHRNGEREQAKDNEE